ncbi:putative pentatricopeptide repeat-containing protein At1g17630 [Coffea eugenioides]|uniref:putative pentatricopeptide repeat-containing protein At1g17630 n=1 Tax=Coffea eugenioides TaxID=49369 RepID=UPI000F6085A5|nr:putative pentatricopeptide repeat-containing protein At1g17630 [Coffea eugenioides]
MLHAAVTIASHSSNSVLRPFHSLSRCLTTPSIGQNSKTRINAADSGLVDFFDHLLQQCINGDHLRQLKQTHSQIIHTSTFLSPFLAARLVSVYSKFGLLKDARKVFDTISSLDESFITRNMLLWNSILRANVVQGEYNEALRLYCEMRKVGVLPDGFGFPLIVKASGRAMVGESNYKLCTSVHCHVVQLGFRDHMHVVNELLGMYGKIGRMDIACKLFDRMPVRTQISWNVMVSGFANNSDCENASKMFDRMELEGWEPNSVTWTSLLSSFGKCGSGEETLRLYRMMREKGVEVTAEAVAVVLSVCADMNAFCTAANLHGYVIKGGFSNYSFVVNSLICVCGKNCAAKEAESLFSGLESKNIVSWNALISCYAESGLCDEAFALFSQMGKLHDGYAELKPNVITWSAVISGFAAKGRFEESLEIFRQMQIAEVAGNPVTIASTLTACAGLSAHCLGKEIHAHVTRTLLDKKVLVGNGLINMYMKCACPEEANLVFEGLGNRDLFSWNTMIAGYGMLGLGDTALKFFYNMINIGFKPDEVTFVAVLSACSHAGLVAEGRKLFDQMVRDFRIESQMEHYACVVDLLGRAGLVLEAIDFVKNMPIEPNACVWGALLNSCKMYKNTDAAEETAAQIFGLEPGMTGSYMLISNLYAAQGRWEDSAKVRHSAKTVGLKKSPGRSWIEVKKKVHAFLAGEALDSGMEEIYRVLDYLSLQMEMESYALCQKSTSQLALEEECVAYI